MDDGPVLLHHSLYNSDYPQPIPLSQARQLTTQQQDLMAHLDRLKFFLATAPSRWSAPDATPNSHHHPALNRFLLPSGEYVTCVLWSGLYHITGTDIVRALVFRFEAFGRPVRNMKKFEEGVFSDLRNLKPGHDACLEEPKSPFLDLLFKYQCIRTQKKQKVFYWFSVPHDRLFLDALERDLKREKMGLESTTAVVSEPAASFSYDPKRSLYEQFAAATKPVPSSVETEGTLTRAVRQVQTESTASSSSSTASLPELDYASGSSSMESAREPPTPPPRPPANPLARSPFFSMFSLFEGSPTYKQRRKKIHKSRKSSDEGENGRPIIRSHTHSHSQPTFLAGPGQFGFASPGTGFPPSAHVRRPDQHAPPSASEHMCPLFSCRMGFECAELLQEHMHTHERDCDDEPELERDMDVDQREVGRAESDSPQAQFVHESPETPQFAHVLTSPGGSPRYDDEQTYHVAPQWAQHPSESPAYNTDGAALPSPGYMHGFTYDSPGSSSDALTIASTSTSSQQFYAHQHTQPYPVSAPSHRLTFDHPIMPPSAAPVPVPAYPVRRPRSVTPSIPDRVTHVRRPSTANEVPSSFGASGPAPAWRGHQHQHYARGYHPYAVPNSTRSSPGTSHFVVSLNTPAGEYPPAPAPAPAPASPHLQTQFAHMVSLESEGAELELVYPQDAVRGRGVYNEGAGHGVYPGTTGAAPESPIEQPDPAEYDYAHAHTEYASNHGSPPHGGIYQMVQGHEQQLHQHQHYYEQQQVV